MPGRSDRVRDEHQGRARAAGPARGRPFPQGADRSRTDPSGATRVRRSHRCRPTCAPACSTTPTLLFGRLCRTHSISHRRSWPPWPRTAIQQHAEARLTDGRSWRRASGRRCWPTLIRRCGGPPRCGSADGTYTSPPNCSAIRSPRPRRSAAASSSALTPNGASPSGRTLLPSLRILRCPSIQADQDRLPPCGAPRGPRR